MIKNASQGPESISSRVSYGNHRGLFFVPKSITVATLLSLSACGGGGGDDTSESPPDSTTPPPVSPGPQKAQAHIELGAISGGSVTFKTLGGKVLASNIVSASDGSIEYIPEEILKALGTTEQWILLESTGGYDTDANDDGVVDPTPIPIQGSFSVIISRKVIEKGEPFIANPRAGVLTENILQRGGTITQEILDNAAKEMGASDSDNNGVVNYRDILFTSMKNVSDFSRVIPLSSGYISSVHSGDTQAKVQSLINISLTENHLSTTILPDQKNPNSHNPALEIKTTANGGKILFTLDNSSPHPNNPNTQTATGSSIIPSQNAVLYYREMFQIDGKDVLGKVQRFDLSMDWIELSQEKQTYNPNGKSEVTMNQYPYKDTSYTIITETGVLNPGYTYPKYIGCYVGTTKLDGCELGPYLAYTPAHESRIFEMIHTEAKSFIDTIETIPKPPDTVTPPPRPENTHEVIAYGLSYRNLQYGIYNDWTLGTDGKKTYPIQISGEYRKKDGTIAKVSGGTISDTISKSQKNIEFENKIKSLIDMEYPAIPPPGHRQNEEKIYQENQAYYGGWYKILNQWNLSGTSDFPVKVIGTYAIQNKGRQPNIEYTANNENERVALSEQLLNDIQSRIRAGYNENPPPNYPKEFVIDSGFISYKSGYGYNIITTMNVNGNADYPATIYVRYTSPSGGGSTQTLTAHNATELTQVQNERANDAKARIDLELQNDIYPPGATDSVIQRRSFATGSYEVRFTYSLNNGQDYPGYLDAFYTRGDGYTGKITMEATNANQKNSYAPLLEQEARTQIDNYPYYSPNTITSSGVISYGSRGSSYEIFAKYNRVGTGNNYPALVWIQYRSGTNGQLLDTRNTYGITEARDSEEKERIKSQLESWVRGQIIAANGDMNTQYARDTIREKVLRFLPFGTAHAATNSTISVRKGAEYFGKVSPYTDPNYSVVQNFLAGVGKQKYLYQKGGNKPGVSGTNQDSIKENGEIKIAELTYREQASGLMITLLDANTAVNCYGAGTTIGSCVPEYSFKIPNSEDVYKKGGSSLMLVIGDHLYGGYAFGKFKELVQEMIIKYPENMLYMYAIIFEEQSHLFPAIYEDSIFGNTIGLSQISQIPTDSDKINFGFKEYKRSDLLDGSRHIAIMNARIDIIKIKLKQGGLPISPEMVGRAWNGGYNCIVGNCNPASIGYGKRIQSYYDQLGIYYDTLKK